MVKWKNEIKFVFVHYITHLCNNKDAVYDYTTLLTAYIQVYSCLNVF